MAIEEKKRLSKEKKQLSPEDKRKRRKKIMKIILIIIGVVILAVAIFITYKLIQLNKVQSMSVDEMLSYSAEDEGTYIAVATIDNGKITYDIYDHNGKSSDPALINNDYEIGSISKTMVALLVSRAIDEGKIKLSASISEYLPLTEGKYYPTVERIMTHTAGYDGYYFESEMIGNFFKGRNDFYRIDKEDLLDKAKSLTLKDKDYSFKYSNFGISVMGLVLEAVYQKNFTELLTDYLHNELNLQNTSVATCKGNLDGYWDWAEDDGYIPAGAVISNITDMTAYLEFVMTSDEEYVNRVLKTVKQVDYSNFFYSKMGIQLDSVGLTWIHDTKNHLIWHNGGTSNYNSYIAMNEDRTKGIVMLSNYGPDSKIPVTVIGARMMGAE